MTQLPLISIIIGTYNGEKFLEPQLNSILNQSYPNLEIIISDDASTDSTPSILKKYETHQSITIFYQKQNLGYTKNFEFALKHTKGDCIAFSDQDDIWLPEKVETLFSAIEPCLLVYSDSLLIDDNGSSLNRNLSDIRKMYSGSDSRGFVFDNVVSGHSMMIKKELIQYALPLPNDFFHDAWLGLKAAILKGIVYVDEPLTLYRQHQHTVTKTITNKSNESRSLNKRYNDFEKQLQWIKLIYDNERPERKLFYNQLYKLWDNKRKGSFVWTLFFFLLKNEKNLFKFSKKNYVSKLNEIRKLARGEKL